MRARRRSKSRNDQIFADRPFATFGKVFAPGGGAKGGGLRGAFGRGAARLRVPDRVFAIETRAVAGAQIWIRDARSPWFLRGNMAWGFFLDVNLIPRGRNFPPDRGPADFSMGGREKKKSEFSTLKMNSRFHRSINR